MQVPSSTFRSPICATSRRDPRHALTLGEALSKAIPAFGGKASHYGGIATIGAAVPTPKAFVIPVYYYWQFMQQNGLDAHVKQMLADPSFVGQTRRCETSGWPSCARTC